MIALLNINLILKKSILLFGIDTRCIIKRSDINVVFLMSIICLLFQIMQITKIHVYIYSYLIRLEAAMTVIKRDSLIDFVVTLS